MLKVVVVTIGGIIVIVTNKFTWELFGLAVVIITLIIPKKKKRFRKIN